MFRSNSFGMLWEKLKLGGRDEIKKRKMHIKY